VAGERVISTATAAELLSMLEAVVSADGTGRLATIPNYRVAGKTGTAWISEDGGYSDDRYNAVFAGIAPASNPRLVAVVVINDPRGASYYGGDVAAPVFANVVGGALRILAIPPDGTAGEPRVLVTDARVVP
jgi:cell division protein FtsI (penicillin-binding protein 3)